MECQLATAAFPASAAFWKTWPEPTVSVPAGRDNAFSAGMGAQDRSDNHEVIRWDWNASRQNFVNVRYTRFDPYQLDPRLNMANSRTWKGGSRNTAVNYTRATARWVAETRFGYNYTDFDRRDNFYTNNIADIALSGQFSSGGGRSFAKIGKTYTGETTVSHTRGRHSMKGGGIFQVQDAARLDIGTPAYTYYNRADLLANRPGEASYRTDKTNNPITTWQLGGFIQDDIRITPRLIANLGLRYDYYSVMRAKNGKVFNRDGYFSTNYRDPDSAWNADYLNFAPRISLAWTLDESGKTVLRTGFGVFTNRQNLFSGPVEIQRDSKTLPSNIRLSAAEIRTLGISYPDGPAKALAYADNPNFFGYTVVDPNWRNPYSEQWSFTVQRRLGADTVAEVGYVGTHGVKLIYGPTYNRIDRVTGLRPFPNMDSSAYYQSGESSVYHSMQSSVRKRFSNSLTFEASYTWASSLSYYTADLGIGGGGPQELLVNPQTLAITSSLGQERGPVDYITRHRFTGNWIWELPFAQLTANRSRAAKLLLMGWQVSGIVTSQTGQPLSISQSSSLTNSRPDFVGSSHEAAIVNRGTVYLDPAAFAKVPVNSVSRATVRPGNLGRNSIFGPGFWNLDLALAKRLRMTERVSLQLRVDTFNALNHTTLSGVVTDVNSATFGRLQSTRGARQAQINARLEF